jgi:hypothetical protein
MKLINLIIEKMFKEELDEIRELILFDIRNAEASLNLKLIHARDADAFLLIKKDIDELYKFKYLIEKNILELDMDLFSLSYPIRIYQHEDKINKILDLDN